MSKRCHCDTASTNGYLLGISSGWEQASDKLLEIASSHFQRGQDDQAQELRSLSEQFIDISKERRKRKDEHEAQFPIGEDAHNLQDE